MGTSILGNPIYHINIPCTKLRVRTWNGQLFSGDLPSPYLAGSRSGLIYWRANVLRSTWRWAMDSHRLASSHRNFRISSSTWFIIILPIKRGRNLGLNVQTNIIHHWHHCWSHPIKSQSYLIKSHETQEFLLIFRQMSQVIPQHIPSSGWANGLDGNCRPRSSLIFPACRRLLLSWKKWKGQSGSIAVRCLADLQKWARSYRPRRFHHFFWKIWFFLVVDLVYHLFLQWAAPSLIIQTHQTCWFCWGRPLGRPNWCAKRRHFSECNGYLDSQEFLFTWCRRFHDWCLPDSLGLKPGWSALSHSIP